MGSEYKVTRSYREVTIRNAWRIENGLSLDQEGFALARHGSSKANVRDPEILAKKYVEEIVPFIKDYFGASLGVARSDVIFIRRAGERTANGVDTTAVRGARAPVPLAHIDYTPRSHDRGARESLRGCRSGRIRG